MSIAAPAYKRAAGFTLVEVLVALAVLAIALPALMVSISEQISGFSHIRDKSIAHWVAMNKMTALRLQNTHRQYLPKDRKRGSVEMLDREWFWEVDTQKTANEQLLEVSVMVSDSDDSDATPLATVLNYFIIPQRNANGN